MTNRCPFAHSRPDDVQANHAVKPSTSDKGDPTQVERVKTGPQATGAARPVSSNTGLLLGKQLSDIIQIE